MGSAQSIATRKSLVRQRHGRTSIHRPGRARPVDHQRTGARHRYCVASPSHRRQGKDGCRPRYRIDVMCPEETTRLTELGGALISDFPVGTRPTPQNFPIRNRIIRGMSAGVRVVEAAEHSGTRSLPLCTRTRPRCLRRPGQRDQEEFLGPERPGQAGRETRRHLGGRVGRASDRRASCAQFTAE